MLVFLVLLIAMATGTILFCNKKVEENAVALLYTDVNKIPARKIGLLLGTSKYLSNGNMNFYFSYRIDAAEKLFKNGKIKYIIASGDNSEQYYNEPLEMKNELIKKGVPDSSIILDYAGFRTFDSVIRCKEVFGQDSITIISQKFHNERAVFIANNYGINGIGFNAVDVNAYYGFKTKLRELLARVKLFLDIYILKVRPHFLGEKITIQ